MQVDATLSSSSSLREPTEAGPNSIGKAKNHKSKTAAKHKNICLANCSTCFRPHESGPTSGATQPPVSIKLANSDSSSVNQIETEAHLSPSTGRVTISTTRRHPSQGADDDSNLTFEQLDQVKRGFITLITCNKLQLFYLGTLLFGFCVISSIFVQQHLVRPKHHNDTTCQLPNMPSYDPFNLVLPMAPLMLLLAGICVITAMRYNSVHESSACDNNQSSQSLDALRAPEATDNRKTIGPEVAPLGQVGSWLVVLILYLPTIVPIIALIKAALFDGFCEIHSALYYSTTGATSAALIYIQPQIVDGATSRLKLVTCLIASPCIFTMLVQIYSSEDSDRTTWICLMGSYLASILAGLIKQARFDCLIKESIFSGATDRIQAKVNLEHQRQQQETLLLSVLPAYVAEQVKRNMLKKMTSCDDGQLYDVQSGSAAAPDTQSLAQVNHQTGSGLASCNSSIAMSSTTAINMEVKTVLGKNYSNTSDASNKRLLIWNSKLTCSFGSINQPQDASVRPQSMNHANLSTLSPSISITNHTAPTSVPHGQSPGRRGFNDLYIRTYNNVSLLYGDIVGFTRLCGLLSSSQLVRVLNDLFSHFDHLAEQHKIMRIKILGDCYYGVSGIPEFAVMGAKSRASRNDNHAINCVNMGLDMIRYIKSLNLDKFVGASGEQSSSLVIANYEMSMRIGIHTGHIHSGVIGLKKWQFDVWSNDVSIAMHCESSGVAGRVQVTEATVQQLNGSFVVENAPPSRRDPFLADKEIKTYLIKEPVVAVASASSLEPRPESEPAPIQVILSLNKKKRHTIQRQPRLIARSTSLARGNASIEQSDDPTDGEEKIRTATIGTIRQTLLPGDISGLGMLNSCALASSHQDIKPMSLKFRDISIQKAYSSRSIANLPVELATLLFALVLARPLISCLLEFGQSSQDRAFEVLCATFILLLILLGFMADCTCQSGSSSQTCAECSDGLKSDLFRMQRRPNVKKILHHKLSSLLGQISKLTCLSRKRTICNSIALILVFILVLINQTYTLRYTLCPNPRSHYLSSVALEYYQLSVIVLLISVDSSVNLLNYEIKLVVILAVTLIHLIFAVQPTNLQDFLCQKSRQNVADESNLQMYNTSTDFLLLIMMFWSLMHARQVEYCNKVNFLWRNKLSVDNEELEYISGINKVLLENILPSHVVQYYMANPSEAQSRQGGKILPYVRMSFSNVRSLSSELYHEQHDDVAVMFASIPHFYEFYDESDINKQGLGCIALLNEIICDFDKLLLKNKFSRIEKIKTIGSTYMAAAGLRPSAPNMAPRPSSSSQMNSSLASDVSSMRNYQGAQSLDVLPLDGEHLEPSRKPAAAPISPEKCNLISMIQFATSLMSALNGINKQSFQQFKLRVGVNYGSVIAGVIGAQRPFYDIWGDCVNIASRMESLGHVGRIQVEETTAKILMESPCIQSHTIVKRGNIEVKGKGVMLTYFVDKREEAVERGQDCVDKLAHRRASGRRQRNCNSTSENSKL